MKIGIVGAGMIGRALAATLVSAGHEVQIANSRGPETLGDVADDTGATPGSSADVVLGKDLVVITIEQFRVPELVDAGMFDGVAPETIVVETTNYSPLQRDLPIVAIEDGLTESAWVSEQIGRPVIKAFNTISFKPLRERGQSAGTPGRIALPVSGDDLESKRVVMSLVDAIGFDAIDASTLAESWRLQPGTPVWGALLDADGVREALAAASPERPERFRAGTESGDVSFKQFGPAS
jgi:predicted dinucleotide-binding enzyme